MRSDDDVAAAWARIEAWFARHHPGLPLGLRPGASEAQLAAAEATWGAALPEDVRACWRVHDGQARNDDAVWLFGAVQRLAPLDELVACWRSDRRFWDASEGRHDWLDRAGQVRQALFHPSQLPIGGAADWQYDRLLVDLVPGPAGTPGQVIQRADVALVRVCSGIGALLGGLAEGLEDGRIRLADEAEPALAWHTRRGKRVPLWRWFD